MLIILETTWISVLLLSADLNISIKNDFEVLLKDVVEVKRMLVSFIKKLKTDG